MHAAVPIGDGQLALYRLNSWRPPTACRAMSRSDRKKWLHLQGYVLATARPRALGSLALGLAGATPRETRPPGFGGGYGAAWDSHQHSHQEEQEPTCLFWLTNVLHQGGVNMQCSLRAHPSIRGQTECLHAVHRPCFSAHRMNSTAAPFSNRAHPRAVPEPRVSRRAPVEACWEAC